jgi:uncharacterized protein (DUF427 family)
MANPPDIKTLMPRLLAARAKWEKLPPPNIVRQIPEPNQESVWDYPRPPEIRPAEARIRAYLGDILVMESNCALRIVEIAGAPVYYAPSEDWREDVLVTNGEFSICEWKGVATQYDVVAGGLKAKWGAFSYDNPLTDLNRGFEQLAGWIAPHPAQLTCFLGDERAKPQLGGLYAGWVTSRVVGPIKGGSDTAHW